jgi:trans-aconitate methyltransferase
MAARPSNRSRNRWTVALLDVQPRDRVLEIGCGPGLALHACAERAVEGTVVGIDHSTVMLQQAARRNRVALAAARVRLEPGGPEVVPTLGMRFDKVLLVNVWQFLPDKARALALMRGAMAPGAALAVTYQPRHRNATRADALRTASEVEREMAAAGFVAIRTEELGLRGVPAVCVLGSNAGADRGVAQVTDAAPAAS